MNSLTNNRGITLIEVIVTVVIAGILAAVAMSSLGKISETGRVEETKNELMRLETAIVGNEQLENNGTRTDFGYVGDIGAMPPNLDALISNPSGYATWNGPYIESRFTEISNDFKEDAWGTTYAFSGNLITSTGSGSDIVRKIGKSVNDYVANTVGGNLTDVDGNPPADLADSLTVLLTYPNGLGGTTTASTTVNRGGYFSFGSIPIGSHTISLVYRPTDDTLRRYVTALPSANTYGEYAFTSDYFGGSGGGGGSSGAIEYVNGTALTKGGHCDKIEFDITNTSGSAVTITSMATSWSSPTAYYKKIKFDNDEVFEEDEPRAASGDLAPFDNSKILSPGETVTMKMEKFEDQAEDGDKVDMSNVDMTITFSDGSVITFNTGSC